MLYKKNGSLEARYKCAFIAQPPCPSNDKPPCIHEW